MKRPKKAQPLAGRRIVITRRREQAGELHAALKQKGATVVELPTIGVVPLRDSSALQAAIACLENYHWVVFTSANGVENFFAALRAHGKDAGALRKARIAAIGPATAAALKHHRVSADVVPKEFRAEGLLTALRNEHWQGRRVLLARAAVARAVLPRELRRRGARVDVVATYQTVLPRMSKKRAATLFGRRKPDAITFTSSSTVKNFFALLGRQQARRALAGVAVATIGPVTSRTARALGLRVAVEAKSYTIAGLVRAIENYFRDPPAGPTPSAGMGP